MTHGEYLAAVTSLAQRMADMMLACADGQHLNVTLDAIAAATIACLHSLQLGGREAEAFDRLAKLATLRAEQGRLSPVRFS